MKTFADPVSRALVALIFVLSGLGKLANYAGTKQMMAGVGFPAVDLFLVGAIALEIGGGLALLAGFKTRWAAAALIVFLIPATIVFHLMPMLGGGEGAQMQMINVLKNVAIMGALVKFWADGAGAYSADAALERPTDGAGVRAAA